MLARSPSHRQRGIAAIVATLGVALLASCAAAATCGDGTVEPFVEQCDDGNVVSGDGCSADCREECPSLDGDWLAQNDAPGAGESVWTFDEDAAGTLVVTTDTGDTLNGTHTPPGVRSTVTLTSTLEPLFTLSGEMFTCDEMTLDIHPLPYAIKLTRIVPPPVCPAPLLLSGVNVKLANLTSPAGKQTLVATGRIALPPGLVFHPESTGAQILLEDLGSGGAAVFDVTYATRAIPSSPAEPCAARGEGWRRNTYRSVMKPLDAESCRLGTADVLTLRLADLRPRHAQVAFTLRVRGASIAAPVGPLRLTLALGTTAEALADASCGIVQPVLACTATANGKQRRCR